MYGDAGPGYPLIRVRFGVDYDIYYHDEANDHKIGNCHPILSVYIWMAIVLLATLFIAWCIVETLIAYAQWIAADEIRERTRKQIEKFPAEIQKLDPKFKLMDKNKFISASCYHSVRFRIKQR